MGAFCHEAVLELIHFNLGFPRPSGILRLSSTATVDFAARPHAHNAHPDRRRASPCPDGRRGMPHAALIRMSLLIDPAQVEFNAIRAQGPGGQNVNKVSCAVHLRFDIGASSLPEAVKARLMAVRDTRITADGVVVLKAQGSRSLEQNKADALRRLQELVDKAAEVPLARKATRPTRGSQRRRLDSKARSGQVKALRGRVRD